MAKTIESWAKDRGYVYPHVRKVEGMCGGRPCIDGTRVRVVTIVFLQKEGHTPEQILEKYPDLNLARSTRRSPITSTTRKKSTPTSRRTKPGTRGTSAIGPCF
jgi:uncharacterized protein (DUF433 family)